MNETTQNLLDVFANLEPWSLPVPLFRLYYNDQGQPIEYTQEDKPGNYIDVDPVIFRDRPMNVLVINGTLTTIQPTSKVKKLSPSSMGVCCDVRDICVVVNETQAHTKWSLKINETN